NEHCAYSYEQNVYPGCGTMGGAVVVVVVEVEVEVEVDAVVVVVGVLVEVVVVAVPLVSVPTAVDVPTVHPVSLAAVTATRGVALGGDWRGRGNPSMNL